MSTSITSSNNLNLAAEAARLAQAQLTGQSPLPPNTTITASYSFAVADDGTLTPKSANIVTQTAAQTNAPDETETPQSIHNKALQQLRQSQASLRDITNPKVQLSPSDEVEIFAQAHQQQQPSEDDFSTFRYEDVKDEAAANLPDNVLSIAAKQQQNAANLYSRNADIIYNVEPVIYQAA